MKRNHIFSNSSSHHSNVQNYSNKDAELIIKETRKNLNAFLENLKAKENSLQLYEPISKTQHNKKTSPKIKKQNVLSTPVIPRPLETCPNQLSVIYKKKENISPLPTPNKTKQNLSSANLNKRKTRNVYTSPIVNIQSQPRSQTKLNINNNRVSSGHKSKLSLSYITSSNSNNKKKQPLQKVQDELKKIKNANNENKKAILSIANVHKKFSQEILAKIKEYTNKAAQKEKILMNLVKDAKNAEKDSLNELQKYKQYVGKITNTKKNLIKEKTSLSQEKDEKIKEIITLKKEIESMRNEKGDKVNEIKSLKDEKEEFKKRNIKLIEENALLQIKLQENKNIQQHQQFSQIPKYSFNNDYLILDSRNSLNYKPRIKPIPKYIIINNNQINFNSIKKPKQPTAFQINKQFQQTLCCNDRTKCFLKNTLTICSKNSIVGYTNKLKKKNKQVLTISHNIKMSISSILNKKPKDNKEQAELLKQIKDITQKNNDLSKNKVILEKQITEQKELLNNKEKEMSEQNMELLKIIEENDHIASELDDKTNELMLKDQEITTLKYDLENITNKFNILRDENEKTKTLLENNQKNEATNKENIDTKMNELLKITQEKEIIMNENKQLQMQIQNDIEIIKKNTECIETLTIQNEQMELKEKELNNKINSLYNELQSIKEELSNKVQEEKENKTKLQQMMNKGYDEGESIESLREKVTMLRLQLDQNNENINKAKEVLKKAKSFDECSKSMDIVLKNYLPKNEEQINALNLLKIIFGFKHIKLSSSSSNQLNEIETIPLDESSLQNEVSEEEPVTQGRGSSIKQKGYLKELLKNLNNKDKNE